MRIGPGVDVPDDAVTIKFLRAGGPGGQNVNKVATAVELRLDLRRAGLPTAIATRLRRLAGRRLTADDEIVLFARSHRTQARNRDDALQRLADLVQRAQVVPKQRVATKPRRSVRRKRREGKKRRGNLKKLRRRPDSSV